MFSLSTRLSIPKLTRNDLLSPVFLFDRPKQRGRRHRVVAHHRQAGRVRYVGDLLEIRNVVLRIAHTLEEIWTVYNPNDKHGVTNDLTKDQLNDLIEYIKTF